MKWVVHVRDRAFFEDNGMIADMGRAGFTLVDVDVEVVGRECFYSAIFRSGVPFTQYWELTPNDFRRKLNELNLRGIRLIALDTYTRDNTLFYAGVFQKGAAAQHFPGDLDWTAFTRRIDERLRHGYVLSDLTVFLRNGEERFLGVWRLQQGGTMFWVSEWNSLAKQIEVLGAPRLQFSTMAQWTSGTQRRYAGVWRQPGSPQEVVAATDPRVFQRKAVELAARSLVPVRIMIEPGYQPPVGLAAAFHDGLDPVAIGYSYSLSEAGALTARGGVGFARAPWEQSGNFPGVPMRDTTRMDIASAAKAVTTTAIFRLLEGSRRTCRTGRCTRADFGLDTPISSILNGYTFGTHTGGVTVGMLVDMTSNLYEASCDEQNSTNLDGYARCVLANCTMPKPQSPSQTCAPPPGQFQYNGADSSILRLVIEELADMSFEDYMHRSLFGPAGANNVHLPSTFMENVNCNPDLLSGRGQPLYYQAGAGATATPGAVIGNDRARSAKVCGAGAIYASVRQLDRFLRALTNGVNGGPPLLSAANRARMQKSDIFGGSDKFAPLGRVFAKNGGFSWGSGTGMVSSIVIAAESNIQLSGIANTSGEARTRSDNPWTVIKTEMQDALIDGLVRLNSRPEGAFSIRARNNAQFGDMCLNVSQAALGNHAPGGGNIPIIQWTCGVPVAQNMQFLRRVTANGPFLLQAVHSGRCLTVNFGSQAPGTELVQWLCNGDANALFSFRPTSGGFGQIVASHSGLCLEIKDASVFSGAQIVQNRCAAIPAQEFKFAQIAD